MGPYYREVSGNYILQEIQSIPFASFSAVDEIITDENLPLEIRESIQRRYERACSIGQEDEDYKSEYFDDPYETAIAFRNTGAYDWVTASVDDLVLSFVN